MKMTLSVKNQSVETSGLPKDYREALCEYIWNGYEANATEVNLSFNLNATGQGIDSISITDNGEGIKYISLSDTFGSFLVSQKNTLSLKAKTKANKGKGRFSFGLFSSLAVWKTCYLEDEKYKSYSITLLDSKKEDINYDDQVQESLHGHTGTTVTFYNIHNLSPIQLSFEELQEFLLSEFSWFLYLHKNQNYKLVINGKEIQYAKHINEHLSCDSQVIIQGQNFSINLIVWNNKIKEKFCCYFLTEKGVLCNVDTTTFNRNTVDFNHSVFITSAFFDHYSNISLKESWFLAGVNQALSDTYHFKKYYKTTNSVTKEMFLDCISLVRDTRLNILLKILAVYNCSLAENRNNSFASFYHYNQKR